MGAGSTAEIPAYRLDVDRYQRIVDSGALDGERVELLDGVITPMTPQYGPHATVIMRLTRYLSRAPHDLRVQLPLVVLPDSMPEPDLAVVTAEFDPRTHPGSADLVIEVAQSSHVIDRGYKQSLYAGIGVAEYWIADIPGLAIEVRTTPGPDAYRSLRTYQQHEAVPEPFPGLGLLSVSQLFAGLAPGLT